MRTDFGEFIDPGHPEPNWFARLRFLGLVNELAPEVLEDLRRNVLPLYRQLEPPLQQPPFYSNGELKFGWTTLERAAEAQDASEAVRAIVKALPGWADSRHLNVDWVLNGALATLHPWFLGAEKNAWQGINRSGGHPITEDELFFAFNHHGWVTTTWRRETFEPMIRAAFDSHLNDYLSRVEKAAVERGLVRTGEWRSRDGEVGRRFRHLVLWQVREYSLSQIGKEAGISEQAARQGLVVAAEEVGLPLRPGRRGRPARPPKS